MFCSTNFLQRLGKIFGHFWAILKNVTFKVKLMQLYFGQFLENIGQLLIQTSGHTAAMYCSIGVYP